MKVTIQPGRAIGTIWAPPSKSVSHRALICAALSDGCTVENSGFSKDIAATLRCLEALGATVEKHGDALRLFEFNPHKIPDNTILDCGESGSTLRFLLPLCLISGKKVTFKGFGRLMERPMAIYEQLCIDNGFLYEQDDHTITVCGRLQNGTYSIPGNVSSQFITGMLLALTQVSGESRVEVTGEFESASYVAITLSVLSSFGVAIKQEKNAFIIPGNQPFLCRRYTVEGDYSNAAYLDALNLLNGSVKVVGLSRETPQGDRVYKHFYEDLSKGKRYFDLSDSPDLGPIMFAMAAVFGGATFNETARLRLKESDRCQAMAEELAKLGIETKNDENTFTVFPGMLSSPKEPLCGHNDHRIVMALSVLLTKVGGTLCGIEAVDKSFPEFFNALQSLKVNLHLTEDV